MDQAFPSGWADPVFSRVFLADSCIRQPVSSTAYRFDPNRHQLAFLAARGWLAPAAGQASGSRLTVALFAAIFVVPGMLLIAYKAGIPRGYYHAVVMALGVFLMILLNQAGWMVLGGILVVLPGLVQLVRFLRRYPVEHLPDERR